MVASFLLQSETILPDVMKRLNLTGWLQSCQEFREEMVTKIKGFLMKKKKQRIDLGKKSRCLLSI